MDAKTATTAKRHARLTGFFALFLLLAFSVFGYVPASGAVDVSLSWDPSSDPAVVGYRLYYGTSDGNYTEFVEAGNRTDCTVTGLSAGTTYYFAATAYNANGGESAYSNVASYTTAGATPSPSGSGGRCLIATAAWGSGLAPEVVALKEFRDRHLLTNGLGRAFVEWYYKVSPSAAAFIAEHESLRTAVRWSLSPVVYAVRHPAALLLICLIPIVVIIGKGCREKRRGWRKKL